MKPFSSPTSNTRINTRSPYDSHEWTHGFIRSPYDQYGCIRLSYDQYGSNTNYTWSSTTRHGLYVCTNSCMVLQSWGTTDNTTCCHIERNPIMPPRKKKAPKRIATSENTKRASKALQPLQPADPIDPDELGDALVPPDETSRDSKIYEAKPSKRVNLYQTIHECVIIRA